MIYTVTINPSLDYVVETDSFKLGMTNRATRETLFPGGKGINVSMVLKNLGYTSIALGFAAGFTGEELIRRLEKISIRQDFIFMEDGFTRINLKLKTEDGTELNGQGPAFGEKELQLLMERLDKLEEGDVLFLAGSVPGTMPQDLYGRIMERLDGRGIMIVADAVKELLLHVLPYHPFLIKPNHHELGELFGVKIATREEAVPYCRRLQDMGAVNVLVSMAGEGAVLVAEDGTVISHGAPEGKLISSVGAGDSMTAGFVVGWLMKHNYHFAYKMGLSAGSASAFSEELATAEEIKKVMMGTFGESF